MREKQIGGQFPPIKSVFSIVATSFTRMYQALMRHVAGIPIPPGVPSNKSETFRSYFYSIKHTKNDKIVL